MHISDFLDYIGRYISDLNPDEGIRVGSAHEKVSGILVCFMATVDALEHARHEGCSLVVCHEDPFLPYEALFGFPQDALKWSANRNRLKEIVDGGLTVVRIHGNLDRWLIYDMFREKLGLPSTGERDGFERVYTVVPEPLAQWIDRTKAATGISQVRYVGDPRQMISRIGLAWGGLGLFVNAEFIESLIRNGAELLIGGESDDYAMRYMADAGVTFIETGHWASENPGLEVFASVLREAFPEIKVVFYRNRVPYNQG